MKLRILVELELEHVRGDETAARVLVANVIDRLRVNYMDPVLVWGSSRYDVKRTTFQDMDSPERAERTW